MKRAILVAVWVVTASACDMDEGDCRNVDVPPPRGGLVFTEVMVAPSGGDVAAEWVELRNVLPWPVDPGGLHLVSGAANVVLSCEGPVLPGAVFVAAGSADSSANGGLQEVHCTFTGFSLPDHALELPNDYAVAVRTNRVQILTPDGIVIDDIPYLVPGIGFPDVVPGASLELCAEQVSAVSNDQGEVWHTAEVAARFSGGDLGTPGILGLRCGLADALEGE